MMPRNGVRWLAVAVSIGMAAAVIAGLLVVGSPAHQRTLRLDARRVSDLSLISLQITNYWSQHKSLPADLMTINAGRGHASDPVSGAAYGYMVTGPETYRLCADFDAASESEERGRMGYIPPSQEQRWQHPAGKRCFDMNGKSGGAPSP